MLQIRKNRIFAIFIGVMFVALDQWVKLLALETLQSQSFRFGGSFAWLDIVLSFNPGAFLSLGAGFNQDIKQLIFIFGVAVGVIFAISWALLRWTANPVKAIAVYFIALGGASNLLDRLLRNGHVVDYLVLNLSSLHTGVFNIADIAIMAGAGFLLFEELLKPRTQSSKV
ncbi:signal peptidase II [Pseudomonas asuensis]|uniref:Lipoprotein signal peptidase n=1 Tax=Pseudomonas asuensis TaxID=1825787 RepID=A0ABQ2H4B6_9PSED|nr:signal peptidase II [Pseudomonas asuensis]GGM29879.1 lipoprotein signal peptidase [Pseudomonas asuensis]